MTFKNIKTADDLAAEKLASENAVKVSDAKKLLDDTDYVFTKIGEAKILGKDISSLLERYADTIAEREAARALINELEQ